MTAQKLVEKQGVPSRMLHVNASTWHIMPSRQVVGKGNKVLVFCQDPPGTVPSAPLPPIRLVHRHDYVAGQEQNPNI
jgi:hypothetical protein